MSRRIGLGCSRPAAFLALITLSAVCLCSAAPAAQARSCGSEEISGSSRLFGDVDAQVRVIRGRVSCATARRVARAFFKRHGTYVDNGYGYNSYWAVRGGWRGDAGMGYWTFRNVKRGARVGGNFESLGSGSRREDTAVSPARAPRAGSAEVHDCNHWAYYPNLRISSARNMSCRVARGEMRRYKRPISYRFTTPYRRFRCQRVSGMELGGQWRCTRGSRAFRFDFGD